MPLFMKNNLNLMVLADILQLPTDWLLDENIVLRILKSEQQLLLVTFVHEFINPEVIEKSPYFVKSTNPYVGVPFFAISDYYFDLSDDFDIDNIHYENDVMK